MKIIKPAAGPLKNMRYKYGSGYDENLEKAKNLEKSSGTRVFVNYEYWTTKNILEKEKVKEKKGWVGTERGLEGFLKKTAKELEKGKYEYTPDSEGPIRINISKWISLDDFIEIYNYQVEGITPSDTFMRKLRVKGLNHLLRRRIATPRGE